MSADFLLFTFGELKEKALKKKNTLAEGLRLILERPIMAKIKDIKDLWDHKDQDFHQFGMGLLLSLLVKETIKPDDGLEYHSIVLKLIEEFPNYKESILGIYKNFIMKVVSALSTIEDLEKWTEKIVELEALQYNSDLTKQLMHGKYLIILYTQAEKLRNQIDIESLKNTAITVQTGQKFGLELKNIGNIIFNIGTEYAIKKYNFYNLQGQANNQNNPQNYEEIKDLFGDLKRIGEKDTYNTKKLELIERKIGFEIPVKPIPIPPPPPPPPEPVVVYNEPEVVEVPEPKKKKSIPTEKLLENGFNKNKVVWRSKPTYSRGTINFSIEVLIGDSPQFGLIAKKTYNLYNPEDYKNIENEIKILTVLSNRAKPDNGFIKFYGSEMEIINQEEIKVSLYMEAHKTSLIEKITELKAKNQFLDKEVIENAVRTLIQSFNEMQILGIYHRDIKPHNILFTDDSRVKIIDFSVSETLRNEDCYTMMTGVATIQGTQGYMAPEIEDCFSVDRKSGRFRPGRADVFSLGLTIFQMISLKATYGLNSSEQNQRLLDLVNDLNVEEWIKILLSRMLISDYHERASFRECLKYLYISGSTDKTIIN